MEAIVAILGFSLVITLVCPAVALVDRFSWKKFLLSCLVFLVGITFPVLIFLFSSFLVPEWTGDCPHGWLDCFIEFSAFFLVPFYTAVWYTIAFVVVRSDVGTIRNGLICFWLNLPCWLTSLLFSVLYYQSLPEESPDCFVVTAAQRGHRGFRMVCITGLVQWLPAVRLIAISPMLFMFS